jgi:hypothetical protein
VVIASAGQRRSGSDLFSENSIFSSSRLWLVALDFSFALEVLESRGAGDFQSIDSTRKT